MSATEPIAQQRREVCRREVLRYLAERVHVAHHPNTIRNRLNAGHEQDFTAEEIAAALAFLGAMVPELVHGIRDSLGATQYYQATAAGVLAHERGG